MNPSAPLSDRRIVFPERGRAECRHDGGDHARPLAADEIVGTTISSVISPGTELGMQFDSDRDFPHYPGYGAVFAIEAVGSGVDDLAPGDRAFCIGPHAGRQRCRREEAVLLPPGLDPVKAATARLATISWARLTLSQVRPPTPILITGLGPVGHFACRIAAAWGHPVLAVDPQPERRRLLADVEGVNAVATVPLDDERWRDRLALALECSGNEEAVYAACCLLRPGSEVVILGVPWRARASRPLRDVLWKTFWRHLRVCGGWEWELPWAPAPGFHGCYRDNVAAALAWLTTDRFPIGPLIEVVSPADCQRCYDDLHAGRCGSLFQVFDWRDEDARRSGAV